MNTAKHAEQINVTDITPFEGSDLPTCKIILIWHTQAILAGCIRLCPVTRMDLSSN